MVMFLVDGEPPWLWASTMADSAGSLRQGSPGVAMVTNVCAGRLGVLSEAPWFLPETPRPVDAY